MKIILRGLIIISFFSMCSKSENNDAIEQRSDEEIALSQLTSPFGWGIKSFPRFSCENFEFSGETQASQVYTMSLNTNGEYQIRIGIGGIAGGLVISGNWTFIRKVDKDTYEFENTFKAFPENIPSYLESPLLKEGVYRINFRDNPGRPKGFMTMISMDCINSQRDGFEWK